MKRTLIHNATIVNEHTRKQGSLVLQDGRIEEILTDGRPLLSPCDEIIDATGCLLLPGAIDDHVHFREPGLTHKADILSESRAAVAGGVTSVMDMPNTVPQTTTLKALEYKQALFRQKCLANHSCYFGATHDNFELFPQLDKKRVCGIKLFLGSSTGNMLVDDDNALRRIFEGTDMLIAAHCEDQRIIDENIAKLRAADGPDSDYSILRHRLIRSAKACNSATRKAVLLARKTGARLHVLHVSTAKELTMFTGDRWNEKKRITAEACVGHLMFDNEDVRRLGACIKCNPAIKLRPDRDALREAINTDRVDGIPTDHAPHLLTEKAGGALRAASGMPSIQFSLVSMLQLVEEGCFTVETLVEKMCHNPARMFHIEGRGFIREGYNADLVLVRKEPWTVTKDVIQSKCGWSPFEGMTFDWKVETTFVNGHKAYDKGVVDESKRGEPLWFYA